MRRADLLVGDQYVGVLQNGLLAVLVGDEVGRNIALVELHTLGELELDTEGVGLLHGDDALFADLVDGLGDDLADGRVSGRDRSHLGNLSLVVDFLGQRFYRLHGRRYRLFDTPLEGDGIGPGGNVAQSLAHQGLGQHGGRGGTVAGDVVGLGRHFLHELGAHVLEVVLQLDLLGNGHAVVGYGRGAPALADHDVAPFGPEGHFDRVGQLVDAGLQAPTGLFVEMQLLGHYFFTLASTSRLLRTRRSSLSIVTSVPPYFE